MNIKLMNFAKRNNSTKKPILSVIDYREFNGKIREPSSVISLSVAFNIGQDDTPVWNYAYIEKFARYYFINEWTFNGGLWVASMTEDFLASYKDNILRSTQYVLRSSSNYNGAIDDNMYPTTVRSNDYRVPLRDIYNITSSTNEPNFFSNRRLEDGYFVVGVVGGNTTGITYYCMDYSNFSYFIREVFNYTPSDFGDIGSGMAKQLANPSQYITSVMWYPVKPGSMTFFSLQIFFGYYSVNVVAAPFGSLVNTIQHYRGYFTLRPHPQVERGSYMNLKMKRTVIMNPWGSFAIDPYTVSTIMDDDTDSEITAEWYVDYITGKSWLYITGGEGTLIHSAVAVLGVPIPIAGASMDLIGTILGTGAGVTAAVGSALVGNIAGAVSGTIGAIGSAVKGITPTAEKIGAQGSLIAFNSKTPRLFTYYQYDVDDDVARYGRPLCSSVRLVTLSGYCLCKDAKFGNDTSALSDEVDAIESALNSGVYIE